MTVNFDIANLSTMTERDGSSFSFPVMLHRMLSDIDELAETDSSSNGLQDIVSWQAGGKNFKIHDRKRFISVVMPVWFMRIKYSSWIRQLNNYGFKKIHEEGPNKGGTFGCKCSTSSTKEERIAEVVFISLPTIHDVFISTIALCHAFFLKDEPLLAACRPDSKGPQEEKCRRCPSISKFIIV